MIVATVNALKVKSCWIDAPDAEPVDPYRPRPDSKQFRPAHRLVAHSRCRLRIPVNWPHKLFAKARAASGKLRRRPEGS